MEKLLVAVLLWLAVAAPAQAFGGTTGYFNDLHLVSQTRISGPDTAPLALCHTTYEFRILGLALTSEVTGYALSSDNCTATVDRIMTADQLATAQSLGLVDADVPSLDQMDWQRKLRSYGFWLAIALALVAVMIRRIKSLLGLDPVTMRKKAATRILSAMCHAGKCDGIVTSGEVALIRDTAERLTGWIFGASDVMRLADQIDLDLTLQDYIAFGEGLRDREKDVMMHGVLSIAIASGRIFPEEYSFVTALAHGLGMPGAAVRRALDLAIADMKMRGT